MDSMKNVAELESISVRDDVVLRPLAYGDATVILEILGSDDEIRKRVGIVADVRTEDNVRKIVDDAAIDDTVIRYAITDGGMVVGMLNFWRAGEYFGDKAHPDDYGFGYFLAPSACGKGIITDSLRVLMGIAGQKLNVHSFIAFCEDDNVASSKQLEKVGLKRTEQTWLYGEKQWAERKYERKVS